MTTISAQFDAFARAANRAKLPSSQLSSRLQMTFLYLGDAIAIVVALCVAVATRGLLPFPGQSDTVAIMSYAGPIIGIAWLVSRAGRGAASRRPGRGRSLTSGLPLTITSPT